MKRVFGAAYMYAATVTAGLFFSTIANASCGKVTVAANNIALFGDTNLSARGVNYYGVDLAYKGSGIQGRSDNPTLDICSNVYYDGSSAYKYGEGSTTAGQLSVGGNQLIFSSAGSGTAGATATLTEKFRFNTNNTCLLYTSDAADE